MSHLATHDQVVHRRVHVGAPMDVILATFARHRFTPHMHEEFVIATVEEGACQFRCGRATHVARPGHVIVIPPRMTHTGGSADARAWRVRAIYPGASLVADALPSAAAGGLGSTTSETPVVDAPDLARALVALHHLLLASPDPGAHAPALRELLRALAARLAPAAPVGPMEPEEPVEVRRARLYIETNATRVVRLARLAEVSGVNVFRLLRHFRASVGVTPYAYLTQRRMLHAIALLRDGCPISRAALEAGFCDQSHFSRRFRAAFGMPPGQYLRGCQHAPPVATAPWASQAS